MMQMRTHTCNELRLEHVGQQVKIVGWMENVRAVGQNFAFVVLRDFYGTTQVVVENEEMMNIINGLNKESTISVEGVVRERASKNPKQATGDIEVVPSKIEVLGRCRYNSLPFEINRSREADETARLKYRFLDLRNPAVKQNIILRCQVVAALRAAMTEHGFLEITTPILTASSPEGARDYLVPARKHPGKFYALPQAPQQFKQLLMTSGFDRYFQIAPCFRDEDARGDRSPGEFYQLDMEMAFATQDDVFAVLEDVLPPIFAKFGTYNVASSAPFRRIAYRDAMETYGSDKPDLRIDLTCKNVTSLFTESEFDALRGQTVKMVPVSNCKLTRKQIDKLLADCEVQSGSKAYWFKADENGQLAGGIAKFLDVVAPFASGIVIAYVLDCIVRPVQRYVMKENPKLRWLSILIAYIVAALIITLLVSMVVPQVVSSITMLFTNLPLYISNVQNLLDMLQNRYGLDLSRATEMLDNYESMMNSLTEVLKSSAPQIMAYVSGVASNVVDIFTALASSVYMLAEKDKLLRQLRLCQILLLALTRDIAADGCLVHLERLLW